MALPQRDTIPLPEVQVGTLRLDENLRFDTLTREHHYLAFPKYFRRSLCQVA